MAASIIDYSNNLERIPNRDIFVKSANDRHIGSIKWWDHFKKDRILLLMFLPCFIHLIIFSYLPLLGLVVAFQNFKVYLGFFNSQWVGLKNFIDFISSYDILVIIRNTFVIGFITIATFPFPIIFALLLNELRSSVFKKSVQTISYIPFFFSTVVVISIMVSILSPYDGIVNRIIELFGYKPIYFIAESKWFVFLYQTSRIWQYLGFNSIIYIAAISGVSQELYDAAEIDGCNRLGKITHITLPGIMTTMTVMFILSMGGLLSADFERVLLLQNPLNMDVSDVIQTYVYRKGLKQLNYGYATAVGMLNSIIAFILIYLTNYFSKKVSDTSIW